MALQGTIDAFPLTDVLQLLSASHKTGRLVLDGDRGEAALWIDDGEVVGGDGAGPGVDSAALLVFEMLRFVDGSFDFDSEVDDRSPSLEVEATSLAECLEDAGRLLAEWTEIAAVVPSLAHRVTLVGELPGESITLDAATWSLVAAVGPNPVVAQLGDVMGLDEFATCAAVATLVEQGLATVDEPLDTGGDDVLRTDGPREGARASEADLDGVEASSVTSEGRRDAAADDDRVAEAEFPERFPIDDLIGDGSDEADDPWTSPEMEQLEAQRFAAAQSFDQVAYDGLPSIEPVPLDGETARAAEGASSAWDDMVESGTADDSDDSTDEVLRQMSKLSPQAAEAIAAALNSVPSRGAGEPVASSDAEGDSDGPVSFMGSF